MRRTVLVALLCAAVVTGCASGYFSWETARKVRVGMTTAEVESILGPPHTIKAGPQEMQWVWVRMHSLFGRIDTLSIPFKEGRVAELPQLPDGFK